VPRFAGCAVPQLDRNTEDPLTELVVLKIVKLGEAGELDPERLCNDVLAELETPPAGVGRQVAHHVKTPTKSVGV
jgi:hypothetical protein